MKKIDIYKRFPALKSPKHVLNVFLVVLFAVVFTGVLVSKYIFFQTIIGADNTSKVNIVAPKNIEVEDSVKTEKRRREVSRNIGWIYTPADDLYIKNNLNEIIDEIKQIRTSNTSYSEKERDLNVIFDISDVSSKDFVIAYFINADNSVLEKTFENSHTTLSSVLAEGLTEKDFEENSLSKIIRRNIDFKTTKKEIKIITAILEQVIVPNMIVDEEATANARKKARESVSPIKVKFNKGDTIISIGEPITQVKKDALSKAGYNILRINFTGIFGVLCLVCIGILSIYAYLKFFEPKFINKKHLSIVSFLSILVGALSVLLPINWSVFLLPFPFFAMILSVFLNPRTAFFITITLLTIVTLALQFSALAMFVFVLAVIITTVGMTTIKYSRRFDLIKVGIYTSFVMAVTIVCVYFDFGMSKLVKDVFAAIASGFFSGIVALGMIPMIENTFKVITMFGLAELGDYNQPLLKKLHEAAPGTFEHCLRVSNLTESAAEAIGANPILARVGALYHDVGKIVRPLFFVENQTYTGIENPHEKLTPRSSKMIITSHTKDGIALAKEYHIPEIIQDFIVQHHGDSLASYFYNQAIAQEGAENVKEEQFRYTGPKPNTKETAILMIADAVESASRTLKDHSQEELDALINKIIQDRLNDNQLSESPLTLKDIKIIANTLSRVLRSVFHKRIKYQEAIEDIKEKVQLKQEQDDNN